MADSHADTSEQAKAAEHGQPSGHADAHAHGHDPFEKGHLIGHVKDTEYFELPRALGGKIAIPQLLKTSEPIATIKTGFKPIDDRIEPLVEQIAAPPGASHAA